MDNKTIVMSPKAAEIAKPVLGIQSDSAFTETAKGLVGRDLCSVADLSVQEMSSIMELAHAVKASPEDFRHGLDAKQMVLFLSLIHI